MTLPSTHRPVLSPGLARLWRQDGTLQLGRTASQAVLLPEAGRHRDVLALLDGTRTLDQVRQERPEAGEVLDQLAASGVLVGVDDLIPVGLHARIESASRRTCPPLPWSTAPALPERSRRDGGPAS